MLDINKIREQKEKIQKFTDLNAWKESHKLVLMIYDITIKFPREEIYGLVSQLRRCAISISSNIAEGFSRHSFRDKANFYSMALGSTTELQNQILVAKDVGYVTQDEFNKIANQTIVVHKLINGLIKYSRSHNT